MDIEPIVRLDRDLKSASKTLSHDEARYLVDYYYVMQHDRIRADNQIRAMGDDREPHEVVAWLSSNTATLERNIKSVLDSYSSASVVGAWAKEQVGIGPVISAGLLAHIDITKARTVGAIWRFAGLDPTVVWGKGEKRPWNADLKRLCWIIGECFTKTSANVDSFYGKLYVQRKAIEEERNASGAFMDQAAESLATKAWKRDTKSKASYEAGQLPQARIHLRAQRWATKIFLAHWHAVAFRAYYGTDAPKPYVLAILGHADEIQVPYWPFPKEPLPVKIQRKKK